MSLTACRLILGWSQDGLSEAQIGTLSQYLVDICGIYVWYRGQNERAVWLSVHNFELLCAVDMNLGWFVGAGCFYRFIGL